MAPHLVAGTARAWEEQQHDLASAARLLGAADTGGFPGQVADAAERFVQSWQVLVLRLAAAAESRTVALGATIVDWVTTDAAAGDRLGRLTTDLEGPR
jgi:hypothetical protein